MKYDQFRCLDWQPVKLTENAGPRQLLLYDVNLSGESLSVIRTGEEITLYHIIRRSDGPYYENHQACTFRIVEELAAAAAGNGEYRLSRISWNGKPAMLDFRYWLRPDSPVISIEDVMLPGCGNTIPVDAVKELWMRIFTGR